MNRSLIHDVARRGIIAVCFMPVLFGVLRTATVPPEPVTVHPRFEPAVVLDGMPELRWTADRDAALWEAGRDRKLVLAVFDATTDTNARLNEINVHTLPEVRKALKRFVLLKLYTNIVPDAYYREPMTYEEQSRDAEANYAFERSRLNSEQEPLYVILKPVAPGSFEVMDEFYEGKITNVVRFVDFLRQPLDRSGPGTRMQGLIDSLRNWWLELDGR